MWDPAPWFVDGALHSAEVARVLAYAATHGEEGVILPHHLRVRALAVPGQAIRVYAGAAAIRNRYPGGSWYQTYVGHSPTEHTVDVSPTGSSGRRSDLIVARVVDPQYPGTPEPADPTDFQYIYTDIIENVPAGTQTVAELGLNIPAIELARIDFPPNTATVTQDMITDLRRVANPRKDRIVQMRTTFGGVQELTHRGDSGDMRAWPNLSQAAQGQIWMRVPEWASRANIIGTWGQVRAAHNTNTWGQLRVGLEGNGLWVGTRETRFTERDGFSGRKHYVSGGEVTIPEAMRGELVDVVFQGRRAMDSPTGGDFVAVAVDEHSMVVADVEFLESSY